MVESLFWSNYRLTVQSSDYVIKWLHQECFLENLPPGQFKITCPQPSIFEYISRKYRWQGPSFVQITDWLFRVQLYTKMTPPRMFSWKSSAWTVQNQLSTAIHFRKFLQKIQMIESFFCSNYRLAVQSSDYILKWLQHECFLVNLPKAFGASKYHAKVTSSGCGTFAYMKQIFPWIIFFFS